MASQSTSSSLDDSTLGSNSSSDLESNSEKMKISNEEASSTAANATGPIEWSEENLEKLRLCRNRAYAKVNTKRRQHLPASLSSFLLREWQMSTPDSPKVTAKYLLNIYISNFETPEREKKRVAIARKRSKKDDATSVNSPAVPEKASSAHPGPGGEVVSQDDHADKQWSDEMLANLLKCGDLAKAKLSANPSGASGAKLSQDLSGYLLEEWLKMYPNSTLSARNVKSRLTVYSKTRFEIPPPSKRRKLTTTSSGSDDSSNSKGNEISIEDIISKDEFVAATQRLKAVEEENPNSLAFVIKLKDELEKKFKQLKSVSRSAFRSYYTKVLEDQDETKSVQDEVMDEISDEFVPEAVDSEKSKSSVQDDDGADDEEEDKVCEKHWMHMFHDDDVSVECILTDQMLQVRERLKGSFPGCDLFHPKKPKGFSSMVLKEWKRSYPNSEENIKSISVKFAKYDKMPSGGLSSNEVEKNDSGRINWGPALLNNLQKSRKIALQKCGTDTTPFKFNRTWKKEWKSLYPHLDVEWRTVLNRYQYHFGSLSQSASTIGSNDASQESVKNGGEMDVSPDEKVKGFRNWTSKTKSDLVETKRIVVDKNPSLEPGSSQFNRLLLQEFQKLHPKCMESSRSIYAKVQSLEKDDPAFATPKPGSPVVDESSSENLFTPKTAPKRVTKSSSQPIPKNSFDSTEASSELGEATVKIERDLQEPVLGALSPTLQSPYKDDPIRLSVPVKQEVIEEELNELIKDDKEKEVSDRLSEIKEEEKDPDADSVVVEKPALGEKSELNLIEGFENWSLFMIRDFIACMDTARRKYATLKENDSDGSIKLVPLLLQEWKKVYPETKESVKTFHVKIKHLKLQKEVIKRHLEESKLLPKKEGEERSAEGEEDDMFRWNKSMMPDVISSRKRALDLKDKGTAEGKKLSFHQLWANEFKKVYPRSTFTSNNLSVHFWTWRKQQQKLGKIDPLYDDSLALADTTTRAQHNSQTGWTPALLKELEKLGKSVHRMLRNPDTPASKRGQGFATILHTEWLKRYPDRAESIRALNMCYVRQMKRPHAGGDMSNRSKNHVAKTNWHPKQNKKLRECVRLHNFVKSDISAIEYSKRVIEDWRRTFPDVEVSDEDLKQRISDIDIPDAKCHDVRIKEEPIIEESVHSSGVLSQELAPETLKDRSSSLPANRSGSPALSLSNTLPAEGAIRGPNARGQMCWNKQTIRDLFDAHQVGLQRRKEYLTTLSKRDAPLLSTLVLEEFLKLHPYCKLSPAILMAKCYCWKNAVNKGTLNIDMSSSGKHIQPDEKPRPLQSVPKDVQVGTESSQGSIMREVEELERFIDRVVLIDNKDVAFGRWTSDMLNDMLKMRRKVLLASKEDVSALGTWHELFTSLHPKCKCSKRNLWKKYAWFRSRAGLPPVEEPSGLYDHKFAMSVQAIRNRNIRKDIFLHIKALMEEARIFLPQKLPPDQDQRREILTQLTSENTAKQKFNQSSAHPESHAQHMANNVQSVPPTPHPMSRMSNQGLEPSEEEGRLMAPLNLSLTPSAPLESEQEKKDSIKLPGGATLVAVTDRNADTLLKPKPIEKPNVTITIGEKKNGADGFEVTPPQTPSPTSQASHMQGGRPSIVLPINIPRFPLPSPQGLPVQQQTSVSNVPLDFMKNLRHGNLNTMGDIVGNFIPPRVKARMEELSLSDEQFFQLLEIYDLARFEYIDTLKRGFLTFFPFVISGLWKASYPHSTITGRKLQTIVELYTDERSKGRGNFMPEYLTKKPCQFAITEQLLKMILITQEEAKHNLEERAEFLSSNDGDKGMLINEAMVYVEMCRCWSAKNPTMRMTNKQLISIHQMLTYDAAKLMAGSPEVECTLADIWKAMEKAVCDPPDTQALLQASGERPLFDVVMSAPDDELKYDEDNLSMDQVQEWILAAQNVMSRKEMQRKNLRPRFVTKHVPKFWSLEKLDDLSICRLRAINRKSWRRGKASGMLKSQSLLELMYREWTSLYPELSGLSKSQVMAQCIREIKKEKRNRRRKAESSVKKWKRSCQEYMANEDLNQTVQEEHCQIKQEEEEFLPEDIEDEDISLGNAADKRNTCEVGERNYHNDEHVLDYVRDMQRKGNVTWTADMIKSLMQARTRARQRKKEWETWAIREYGGVGYAYNNPDVKFQKVDEMFLEEWKKARPDHASLSIWTLNAYARKYDNLKKQLIVEHGQGADASSSISMTCTDRKTTHSLVYFPDSGIPKFDLQQLQDLDDVEEDVKALIKTRQLAMERRCAAAAAAVTEAEDGAEAIQAAEAKYRLTFLWEEEWRKNNNSNGQRDSGPNLQKRLYQWESDAARRALLKPALERAGEGEVTSAKLREDELPEIIPRKALYPNPFESDEYSRKFNVLVHINTSVGKKRLVKGRNYYAFHRDLYSETEDRLSLPAVEVVEAEAVPVDEHGDEMSVDEEADTLVIKPPRSVFSCAFKEEEGEKGSIITDGHHRVITGSEARRDDSSFLGKGKLNCDNCQKEYHNVNNLRYHLQVHKSAKFRIKKTARGIATKNISI